MLWLFLLIEFADELVFGAQGAVMPLLQQDLQLNYVQIGLLLSVPGYISIFVEPIFGILADAGKRRLLILMGGLFFVFSLIATALTQDFWFLLASFILFFPASGAFVSLAQSTWMDAEPERRDQNMARWTFAGSLGVVLGPLALAAALAIGFGWRGLYWVLAALSFGLLLAAIRYLKIPSDEAHPADWPTFNQFWQTLRAAFGALKKPNVLRWMFLLEASDLMLDILLAYLALYFVDVAGLTPAQAALAVAVWTVVGLLGDFLLIPLLEKIEGLTYLKVSVWLELILFPAFLLTNDLLIKLILLGLLGFFNSGWYAILKAEQFKAMPGQSGSVLLLDNLSAIIGKTIPLGIGILANAFGLGPAMWILLAGPLALLFGLPRSTQKAT